MYGLVRKQYRLWLVRHRLVIHWGRLIRRRLIWIVLKMTIRQIGENGRILHGRMWIGWCSMLLLLI